MRRVGVLTPFAADDAEGQARLTAFAQALQQAGWTLGQNLRLDYRWGEAKRPPAKAHKPVSALSPQNGLSSMSRLAAPPSTAWPASLFGTHLILDLDLGI